MFINTNTYKTQGQAKRGKDEDKYYLLRHLYVRDNDVPAVLNERR